MTEIPKTTQDTDQTRNDADPDETTTTEIPNSTNNND